MRELSCVVRVRSDRQQHTLVPCHAAMLVDEIDALGMGAQLEMDAPRLRLAHDPEHVDIEALALADQRFVGLREQRDVRIVECVQDALGLQCSRQIEAAVHGRDDEVELREHAVGKIESAVLQDVDLDAFEHADALALRVDAVDGFALLPQPRGIESPGHRGSPRMLGDRDVLQAEHAGRRDHLLQGVMPVRRGCMQLQIALARAASISPESSRSSGAISGSPMTP